MYTDQDIHAGLRIVSILLVSVAALTLLGYLNGLLLGGFDLIIFAKAAFTLWMCWSVYVGQAWARLLLAVVLLITSAPTLLNAAHLWSQVPGAALFVGLIGAGQVAGAICLLAVRQVNAYLEYAAKQS